ncbi:hypothetical protein BDY21DRAFT_332294 [Lineolata rhizophorae]|uniref:Uncharacterized protein n=1 Tax=Lineolata rhizophorae TaxID=578093 RepID=A0A6A6PCK2_9PEZI|nr:hypothetical protein BDY21DRAFT_332294 [Lineolata rhizophorae]
MPDKSRKCIKSPAPNSRRSIFLSEKCRTARRTKQSTAVPTGYIDILRITSARTHSQVPYSAAKPHISPHHILAPLIHISFVALETPRPIVSPLGIDLRCRVRCPTARMIDERASCRMARGRALAPRSIPPYAAPPQIKNKKKHAKVASRLKEIPQTKKDRLDSTLGGARARGCVSEIWAGWAVLAMGRFPDWIGAVAGRRGSVGRRGGELGYRGQRGKRANDVLAWCHEIGGYACRVVACGGGSSAEKGPSRCRAETAWFAGARWMGV